VRQIARNAIIDHYRRRAARPELPAGSAGEIDERAEARVDEPGAEPLRGELAACLRPMIDQLPAKDREALVLTEFEGLTRSRPPAGSGSRCRARRRAFSAHGRS